MSTVTPHSQDSPASSQPSLKASGSAIARQSMIGLLQTVVLVVMLVQVAFVGVLRALPPDTRSSLAFLHRIEWGVYAHIVLILAHVAISWPGRALLTNRFALFGWRLGKMRMLTGAVARRAQIAYLVVVVLLVVASLWVRANGFLVQPAR